MANSVKRSRTPQDPAAAALSAIEEALNLSDLSVDLASMGSAQGSRRPEDALADRPVAISEAMASGGEASAFDPRAEEDGFAPGTEETGGVTLSYLVERLGEAPGTELFQRMDKRLRYGDVVMGTTVRDARKAFGTARAPRHAQVVVPGRPRRARAAGAADQTMVMIAFEDLEAVVKAAQPDFDWAAEFAPRRDLPTATSSLVVRSGVPGRHTLAL